MDLPAIGTRISLSSSLGTIKFVGHVENTTGIWLGVEWDEPTRGKHSGSKNGKQYFECRVPNAGSFIRPSASICYGYSFLHALTSKYIEMQHGSDSMEKVTLGSSNGAIEVEAVGLDKIRGKFARLEQLREISVDYENVATADPTGRIRDTCPNVKGLDLSSSLLPSWDIVALIAIELPLLERLTLNRNRLRYFENALGATSAFLKLTELQLNGTLTNWSEMETIIQVMPSLRLVELGYNSLMDLSMSKHPNKSRLEVVNLDGNELKQWVHVSSTFTLYTNMQRLILTSNKFEAIPFPDTDTIPMHGIKHLALAHNSIQAWPDIDSLSLWLPALETLSLSGNPLVEDTATGRNARQFVIAKIPTLLALDAAAISSRERTDCEIFYLSHIAKSGSASDAERRQEHPRWDELCARHGRPEDVVKPRQDKLSNQLIQLNLHHSDAPVPHGSREGHISFKIKTMAKLRVLPTMLLRTFRLKAFKSIRAPTDKLNKTSIELWLKMKDTSFAIMDRDHDEFDLGWWGLEDGSDIYAYLKTEE